jgi:hypothetical protein
MFETLNHPWLLVKPVFPPTLTVTSDNGLPDVSITVPMRTPYETVTGAVVDEGVGVGIAVDPGGVVVDPEGVVVEVVLGVDVRIGVGVKVGVVDGEGDGLLEPKWMILRAKSGTMVATTITTMSIMASRPLFIPFFVGVGGGGGG